MSKYQIEKYNISINNFKDSLKVIVIDTEKSITYTTMQIDKSNDVYGNTSCENNVSLSLDSNLYNYLINCLEGKEHYNINIYKLFESNDDSLVIDFIFQFEMFKFNYSLNLENEN